MSQSDLFYPDRPGYVNGSDTSRAAADSLSDDVLSKQKQQIVGLINGRPGGLTCDEIEATMGLRHQTASARIRELVLKGILRDTGSRRQTRGGRPARIYSVVREVRA